MDEHEMAADQDAAEDLAVPDSQAGDVVGGASIESQVESMESEMLKATQSAMKPKTAVPAPNAGMLKAPPKGL
jgi:hypothetical protein